MTLDFRSDTVTRPTSAMRSAMARAELGDDVFGDDPTVNRLQDHAAALFGMQAGLYFPTGTQSNLCALMSHCQRGEEVIVGQQAHTYKYEGGGGAVLGSIQPQPLNNRPDGTLDLAEVEGAIKPDDSHFAITRLIALENTIGGKVIARAYLADAVALARRRGLSIHLDGARIFNAAVKLGTPVKDLCAGFDTVSVCLSKGLGAPAGTVLVGKADVIDRARRVRKMVGGAMRQAGVVAAAGLHALEHHVERLAEDHANARRLAKGLEALGVACEPVQTNMVFAAFPKEVCKPLQEHLRSKDILCFIDPRTRLVTHLDLDAAGIDAFVAAVGAFLSQNARTASRAAVSGE
ncbi:low-specificity L-threonine aldolase [Betaproteobacteria bacterium GR16-43]|nr:low-specificity L-threonine aldolase [Betaproteobacteria bacterium GR16-43]